MMMPWQLVAREQHSLRTHTFGRVLEGAVPDGRQQLRFQQEVAEPGRVNGGVAFAQLTVFTGTSKTTDQKAGYQVAATETVERKRRGGRVPGGGRCEAIHTKLTHVLTLPFSPPFPPLSILPVPIPAPPFPHARPRPKPCPYPR
jgi:hypothetical protein